MSKFGSALGKWEYQWEGVSYNLEPTMDDLLELRAGYGNAINRNERKINLGILDKTVMTIFERLVLKVEPNLSPEEKKQLKEYIAINLGYITDEMMIFFKQTTREAIEKAKADLLGEDEDKKKQL